MPPRPTPITLDFSDAPKKERSERVLDLSAVAQYGSDLWMASDETTTIERVSPCADRTFGDYESFRISDYLTLNASDEEEVDIEGLAVSNHYLWITGSHSLKRMKPKRDGDPQADVEALSEIVRETNRFLIGRIPVLVDPDTGRSELHKQCIDPDHPHRTLTAAQLVGTAKTNLLIDSLRDDDHIGRFLTIPAKENGFDIEGMAIIGSRIFLGLRGPVLRGWAVILEIKIEMISDTIFGLTPIGPEKNLYRKHFLDLCGLGIREICTDGDDLLILAGPTMDLDGHVLVYRWRNVRKHRKQVVIGRDDLETVLDFPFSKNREVGTDHPEGMCLYKDGTEGEGLLVIYDSPASKRVKGKRAVVADLFGLK